MSTISKHTNIRYEENLSHFIIFFLPELTRLARMKQVNELLQPGIIGDEPPEINHGTQHEIRRRDEAITKWQTKNAILIDILCEMTNGTSAQHLISDIINRPREAIMLLKTTMFQRIAVPPVDVVLDFFRNHEIKKKSGHSLNDDLEEAVRMIETAAATLASLPPAQQHILSNNVKQSSLQHSFLTHID